ncbi:phage tail fiber protein [Rhodobium gokarnense]|uniref:Uncharacterized protein n=1 Tax=Rhodobium gokarnense TaxID=364296 RepID=A0ABT3HH66_9HYPH|nr:hypothetical protein [Rhodobium gokarnense]MCW2309744.1 hypothetical protein [Rhodobium gokarnense]
MAAMTRYLQKALLDHALGITAFTIPTELWGSLHTASPTESGSFDDEISDSGYSRQSIFGLMTETDLTSGTSQIDTVVNFGPADGDNGSVTYFAISDASSAGNMLLYGALANSQTFDTNDQFQLNPGQLIIKFD